MRSVQIQYENGGVALVEQRAEQYVLFHAWRGGYTSFVTHAESIGRRIRKHKGYARDNTGPAGYYLAMTYLTGFHAMEETARAGARGATLLVATAGPRIRAIQEAARKAGMHVRTVTKAELDLLAPGHRGAAVELPDTAVDQDHDGGTRTAVDLDIWLERLDSPGSHERVGSAGTKANLMDTPDISGQENHGAVATTLVIILDHIEDPHNYGAIIRSADAFGADLVVVPERRAAPQTDVVARASAGALAWVPTATVTNLARAVEKLKKAGFWVWAADMDGTPLPQADLKGRVALVLGSEGSGVSRLVRDLCDGAVSVPMTGHVDSFNVSVAAAICMYEVRRRG